MTWKQMLATGISLATIAFGVVVSSIWLYWAVIDWHATQRSWSYLQKLSKSPTTTTHKLMIADDEQAAHRLDVVGEVGGVMGGGIIAAIGGLGLVVVLTRSGRASHLAHEQRGSGHEDPLAIAQATSTGSARH